MLEINRLSTIGNFTRRQDKHHLNNDLEPYDSKSKMKKRRVRYSTHHTIRRTDNAMCPSVYRYRQNGKEKNIQVQLVPQVTIIELGR